MSELTVKSFNEIPDSDEYKEKLLAIQNDGLKPNVNLEIQIKRILLLRTSEDLRKSCEYTDMLKKELEMLRSVNKKLPKPQITIKSFTELPDSDEYKEKLDIIQKDGLNPNVNLEMQITNIFLLRVSEDLRKSCKYMNGLEGELEWLRYRNEVFLIAKANKCIFMCF